MDTYKKFFVFGLQKSGTKYFKKLIETNTNLKFKTKYVWKHTMNPVDFVEDDVQKFWITKSPYNWANSVIKRHRVDILTKYKKYNLKEEDGLVVRGINVKNLITLYNHYHTMLINTGLENIHYEELLKNNLRFFKDLHKNDICDVKMPPIQDVSTSKFYIEEATRLEYLSEPRKNDPLVLEINKYINKDLITSLGYKIA
jgi:hypothetical protein